MMTHRELNDAVLNLWLASENKQKEHRAVAAKARDAQANEALLWADRRPPPERMQEHRKSEVYHEEMARLHGVVAKAAKAGNVSLALRHDPAWMSEHDALVSAAEFYHRLEPSTNH
jgi:hypothetical protein